MINGLNSLFADLYTVGLVIACIFYLAQCLFGYKLLRFSCAIVGFLFGLYLGYVIGAELIHLSGAWPWLPAAIGAIALSLLAYKLCMVGVFILIFVMCFFLALAIPFPKSEVWNIVAIVVAITLGLIAAILAVRYNKIVVIIATAVFGSINFVNYLDKLANVINGRTFIYIGAVAILALIGLLLQIFMNRRV